MTFDKQEVKSLIADINNKLFSSECYNHSIFSGTLGLIYYYYNASVLLNDSSLAKTAEDLLGNVFDDLNNGTQMLRGSEMSTGASGFTYVINYLNKNNLVTINMDDDFEEMDRFIFEGALKRLEENKIDFLHGSLGALNYFSEREMSQKIEFYINQIVSNLLDKAIEEPYGVRFINLGLERFTEKDVDISLAHGLSGILILLLKVFPVILDKKRARSVIRKGIQTILNHELREKDPNTQFSIFPCAIKSDTREVKLFNRLAWCYGDLNPILLLFRAGIILGDNELIEIAKRFIKPTVKRISKDQTLVSDSHFCHGTSGLVRFYDQLYQESGENDFKMAKDYWLQQTIILAKDDLNNNLFGSNPVSLLEGWAGVALVLCDSVSEKRMEWGKLFLL